MSTPPVSLSEWLFATPAERHRPPHAPERGMAVFVTASTRSRAPHLGTPERRDAFHQVFFNSAREYDLEIVAWVILSEHYHAVLVPHRTGSFSPWINALHRLSATVWNRQDGVPGRQCWHDYWDRTLWTEGDVVSRINYVHQNPVRHGYVTDAAEWPWSSFREFATPDGTAGVLDTLERFPAPRRIPGDDF